MVTFSEVKNFWGVEVCLLKKYRLWAFIACYKVNFPRLLNFYQILFLPQFSDLQMLCEVLFLFVDIVPVTLD